MKGSTIPEGSQGVEGSAADGSSMVEDSVQDKLCANREFQLGTQEEVMLAQEDVVTSLEQVERGKVENLSLSSSAALRRRQW